MSAWIGSTALVFALWASLATVLVAIVAAWSGNWRCHSWSRQGVYLAFAAVGVASAALLHAFVSHDFSLKVVWQYSDRDLPGLYRIAAFWGGQSGSLLFWALALTGFSAAAVATLGRREDRLTAWIKVILMLIAAFFLALLLFVTDPFESFYVLVTPEDGQGLNPLLQNVWMAIHPPVLLIGLAGFAIPFAFGMAALITGRLEGAWMRLCRPWTLVSWAFLGLGSLLGARWAYQELGWGGYWAWDPVENAALIPWLTATAYLHAAIVRERRGRYGRWAMVLLLVTFWLTIFGTFLTRSGLVSSIHAFARSPIGLYFLFFLAFLAVFSALWLVLRWKALQADGAGQPPIYWKHWTIPVILFVVAYRAYGLPWGLVTAAGWIVAVNLLPFWSKSDAAVSSPRPLLFWLSILALAGLSFGVLWGTLYPSIAMLLSGTERQIGAVWFSDLAVNAGLVLLLLLSVCTLTSSYSPWGRSQRRQIILLGVGAAAMSVVVGGGLFGFRFQYRWEQREARWFVEAALAGYLCMFGVLAIAVELVRPVIARHRREGGSRRRALVATVIVHRRRYGAHLAHLGLIILVFSLTGNLFRVQRHLELDRGQSAFIGGYVLTYEGIEAEEFTTHLGVFANLSLRWCGGTSMPSDVSSCSAPDTLRPARFDFNEHLAGVPPDPTLVTNEIALRSNPIEDVYVTLGGFSPRGQSASFEMHINPLVYWLWWGGVLVISGVLLTIWPSKPRRNQQLWDTSARRP